MLPEVERSQTADYMRSLISELCRMASKTDMDTLTYLLRMALLELQDADGKDAPRDHDRVESKTSVKSVG